MKKQTFVMLATLVAGWAAHGITPLQIEQIRKAETPEALQADHLITVQNHDGLWKIATDGLAVDWNEKTLDLTVMKEGEVWDFLAPAPMVIRHNQKDYSLDLNAALERIAVPESYAGVSGVKIRLQNWIADGVPIDLAVTLFVGIDWTAGDVVIEIRPDEKNDSIREVHYPGPVDAESADGTVIPFMQGVYIPRNWPQAFDAPYNDGPGYGLAYGRSLYMPWWGVEKGEQSLMVYLATPEDAGVGIHHSLEKGTSMEVFFLHSLGKLGYTRQVRLMPVQGNYVQMAERYRNVLKEKGEFVSLREKIARTPAVAELSGSPILHTTVLYTDMRDPEKPEGKSWQTSYQEHIANLEQFKKNGIDKLYIHLDGVGFRGYDNLEPDSLPLNTEAGGREGLLQYLKTAKEFGMLVVYHQQYRDYYLDAAGYNESLMKHNEDMSVPIDDYWAGGKNAILCPLRSWDYVRRNNSYLDAVGANVDGCYLDVFAVVPADECYHPEHKVSRKDCYELRRRCWGYIKNKWGITSSEEPVGWAVPYLDLTHHAPHPIAPERKSFGYNIPLHALVYRDSIITPWDSDTRRGKSYSFNDDDIPYLYLLLHGGMPYIGDRPSKESLKAVRFAASLNQQLFGQKMVNHFIPDPGENPARQCAVYEDGTRVTVDGRNGTAEIQYPDGKLIDIRITDPVTGTLEINERE